MKIKIMQYYFVMIFAIVMLSSLIAEAQNNIQVKETVIPKSETVLSSGGSVTTTDGPCLIEGGETI